VVPQVFVASKINSPSVLTFILAMVSPVFQIKSYPVEVVPAREESPLHILISGPKSMSGKFLSKIKMESLCSPQEFVTFTMCHPA